MARKYGVSTSTVDRRATEIEHQSKIEFRFGAFSTGQRAVNQNKFSHIDDPTRWHLDPDLHPERRYLNLDNGLIIAASDFHYWPGKATTMHRALIKFVHEKDPDAFIANGDVMDFPQISRHPPIGWEHNPTVADEIEAAQARLGEIMAASPRVGMRKIWTFGNHDARFNMKLAAVAPEFKHIKGTQLRDHFPDWEPCWSTWVNDDVVFKHRWKGGEHAAYNNTVKSGKTCITGHLHSAQVTPFTDWNGTRYGMDLGCIAEINGQQFAYTEDNPKNWRNAFGVFTIRNGLLLPPEHVIRWGKDSVAFRGQIIEV